VRVGVETLPDHCVQPRHRHLEGYANVVLAGSFFEASFAGLMHAQPGDVLLHGWFDCHADAQSSRGPIQVLRLPWDDDRLEGHFRLADPDALVRVAERDPERAIAMLRRDMQPVAAPPLDWTHELARELAGDLPLPLSSWAEQRGWRPEALSRGFGRRFGVSPKVYRLELRTRRAWFEVMRCRTSLTRIAADEGFSDLPHLSRSIHALTGHWPSEWRQVARPRNDVQPAGPANVTRSSRETPLSSPSAHS
jgi:AraC-like DNA-binding protein